MRKNTQQIEERIPRNKVQRNAGIACMGVAIIIGSAFLLPSLGNEEGSKAEVKKQEPAVEIPAIELTEENVYGLTISLFTYNGKIYTISETHIGPKDGKALLGEKMGITKDSLNEWSEELEYHQEFASTIGEKEVFTVNGYDSDFRLMTYSMTDGARFFEQLNGITITSGEDVFGELKMEGNAVGAKYQTFTEWNKSANIYREIEDHEKINRFIKNLNETKPFMQSTSIMPMNENTKNDEGFREVVIHLKDGSNIHLFVLKHGFVYYNGLYFKMEKKQLMDFWNQMDK